jgi:Tol biopolymer transport system component
MTPLTAHPAREFDPVWSPNGTDIAFISSRIDGKFSLFRRSAGGGEDELLIQSARGIGGPDWSSDGVMIFTEGHDATGRDLWTLVPGGRNKQEFLKTPFNEWAGEFSPDGRWVAYQSNESGRSEVFVRPYPKDERAFPISRGGGRAVRWRGDGKELYFIAPDGMLMVSRIDTSKGFHATVPQRLFQTNLLLAQNNHPYDVDSDGDRFLIPVILNPPGAAPITVVLNWTARLRR